MIKINAPLQLTLCIYSASSAFNDVTKKLRYTQEEKSKLQAENVALQTTLEALYEENENLKKQLEMGFKAFDDKFKETVKLKEKLNLREEQSTAEKEDKSNDDQVGKKYIIMLSIFNSFAANL